MILRRSLYGKGPEQPGSKDQEHDMSAHPFPTTTQAPGGVTGAGLGLVEAGWQLRAALITLRAGVRTALRRHRTRKHLADLDDRLLRDIGVNRLDARQEAARPFWLP